MGRAWLKKGIRTPMKMKLGFKNFYLYSATNHKRGEHFTLLLPYVNTECMNVFLEEFKKKYSKATIIMDGAGWHKSKRLNVPEDIKTIHLPPYAPELNPVERLWRYIKDHTIKNKVFKTLKEIEKVVIEFIRGLSKEVVMSVCRCEYVLYN